MLTLEPLTPDNYLRVLALEVAPEQEHLIAPVVKTIADAFVWQSEIRIASTDGEPVGLVLVFRFEVGDEPVVNIVRFMIDRRHQGEGLGRAMMDSTLEWLAGFDPRPVWVRTSTMPENERALRFWKSAGFTETGFEDGEIVFWRAGQVPEVPDPTK